MDPPMHDVLLQISGIVAIAAALIHGVLSETRSFPRVTLSMKRMAGADLPSSALLESYCAIAPRDKLRKNW